MLQLERSSSSNVLFAWSPSRNSCSGLCPAGKAICPMAGVGSLGSLSLSTSLSRDRCLRRRRADHSAALMSLEGGLLFPANARLRILERPTAIAAAAKPAPPKKFPEKSARSRPWKPASPGCEQSPRRDASATQSACPHKPRPQPARLRFRSTAQEFASERARLTATLPLNGTNEMSKAVKAVRDAMEAGSD